MLPVLSLRRLCVVSEDQGRCVLEACKVSKTFDGPDGSRIEVLRGADLQVYSGTSLSIRGESGSGKSTFLNVVSWLDTPSAGTVWWDGVDVSKLSATELSRRRAEVLGFVFQAYYLMPELNVLENVLMSARIRGSLNRDSRSRAEGLIEKVGLKDRFNQLPGKLSGGERQRVAIARALLNQPSVLLADEPTGNLDEKTADIVMELLLGLCSDQGASLVLVTHNPQYASQTDHRAQLSGGLFNQIL